MVVELSAVRLVSPWFGTSLAVWTGVIGAVLLGLAGGYLLGARLAGSARPARALVAMLLVGAVWTALLPALAPSVCGRLVPAGVALHEAADLLRWGSLAAALVLFGPAAVLLGAAGPLVVELVGRRGHLSPGAAGGRVLAVSTLASLAGTFATPLLLLPRLGVRGTTLTASALLLLGAALLAPSLGKRGGGAALGLALALAALAGALPRDTPRLPDGVELLASRTTPHQDVRVVEDHRFDPPMRFLQVNEGLDSFQSAWIAEPGLLPRGFYYNDVALPVLWDGEESGPWRTLVLGLGAGTAVRVLEGVLPAGRRLSGLGVELDAGVVELAREHMDLDAPELAAASPDEFAVVGGVDARAALALAGAGFDQVVLDAYANQMEIPPHLATREFFAEVRASLRPGGWVVANVGGFGLDDPVVLALGASLSAGVGGRVLALRVPRSRNVTLVARRDASPPEVGDAAWVRVPRAEARLAVGAREMPGATAWLEPSSGPVLTDDRGDVELLQLRSLDESAARSLRGVVRVPEGGGPATLPADVARALEAGDPLGALELAAALPEPRLGAEQLVRVLATVADPGGVLREAERARELGSEDPTAAWHAVDAALEVGDGDRARVELAWLERLIESPAEMGATLPGSRAEWERAARDLASAVRERERVEQARARAAGLGRWTVGLAGGALVALVGVLVAAGRSGPA
jgi:predicted membrane-bound spermidine synthase